MFVVILAQSAATSRAFAARYNERFSENTDLVGLSMANFGAGLSGTFVVSGSPTKTQMVGGAGGRTQLTHLTGITDGWTGCLLQNRRRSIERLPSEETVMDFDLEELTPEAPGGKFFYRLR